MWKRIAGSAAAAFSVVSAISTSYCAGIDCHVPSCASKMEFFKSALKSQSQPTNIKKQDTSSGNSVAQEIKTDSKNSPCPLDREELGRSAWDLVHTMAAFYPEDPTPEEKLHAAQFFNSLAYLYPCKMCAADFQVAISLHPPKVENRSDLAIWCCERHNEVNEKLGKPCFSCALMELDKRWRDGPECWNQLLEESEMEE